MTGRVTVDPRGLPSLLAPKFLPPLVRGTYVRRDRLHDRLSRESSTQLTLVSAPAGFGKTTLVAAWLTELPRDRWAWLSLDSRDNDPVRLWAHLIEALRGLAAGVGEHALEELIRSEGKGPIERWLGPLLNDLVAVDRSMSYLVVDDLHVITDPEVRASVTLFVESMPAWLRLIILTRADPPLGLPRRRAQGSLIEIRQNDLRFEPLEAEMLLRAEGIEELGDDQMLQLMTRTEGWAAALQLAVIVLGDDPTPERLLEITGSNITFADYIASEVVDVVSDELRTFLFTTAVLERVSPSLAQTVSGFDDAGRMLRDAQQRGLFLVALDEQGEWFRYHQLFAEAIQAEARARAPELVRSAHEKAAQWFEHHDDLVAALDHWFEADRPEEALRIALAAGYRLIDSGQVKSVERITRLIPASVVGKDPHRQLDYAMLHNHIDAVACRSWVNEAERSIAALAVPDEQLTRRYHSIRAMCCLLFGEWDDALTSASASIDPLGVGEGETALTQRAGLHLMRAKGWMEETDDAEKIFRTYIDIPWTPPVVRNLIAPCSWALAAAIGGRIHEAELWCSSVTAAAFELTLPQAAHQELLLARALVGNERAEADSVRTAIDELRSTPLVTYHSLRAIAEVELALSLVIDDRFADAAEVLEELALAHPQVSLGPRVHDAIDRVWTELHLGTGDIAAAHQAAGRMRVGFWRDATLAKVVLVEGHTKAAADILGCLTATSPRQQVTLLLLHAMSLADNDQHRLPMLETALKTASTEGMLQTVVGAARGFADVLEPASSVVPDDWMHNARRRLAKGGWGATTGRVPRLYEQPTERERQIVRYLASRLTVPEIAHEIGVTPNTLKSHLKSLYRKLDVTSREEAVAAARQLGIIG